MPYGIDKKQGGDSPENDSWMEGCVKKVMNKDGKDKSSAIAICKSQLKKNKESKSELDFIIDDDIINKYNKYRERYIRDTKVALSIDEHIAEGMFEVHLARNNFSLPE